VSAPDPHAVADDVEARADEWLDILGRLVAIPSENPPGDTTEIADYLTGLLADRGVDHEVIAPKDQMPNVAAGFDCAGEGRHLTFNGHLDTFPVGDRARWTRDPFSGRVEDGRIYGRGVADMHAGFVASLAAFLALYERRDALAGRVTLTATSDEETGSEWGADYLLRDRPEYRGDALINGEPSCTEMAYVGERGAVWFRLSVEGESAHSAYPYGVNAIDALYGIVDDIRGAVAEAAAPDDRVIETIRAGEAALNARYGDGFADHLLGVQTNLDTIEGGESTNLIPESASATVDVRLPPGADGASAIGTVREVARAASVPATVDVLHHTDPTFTDPDAEIVRSVVESAARVRGEPPTPVVCAAMTDARFYRRHGVPSVCYGPTKHNMGAPDEYVTVEDVIDVARAQAMAAVDYLAGG